MLRDTDKEYVRILFDTLINQGVDTIVSSPGSRNIPLLLAAEARKGKLRDIIIADERTASFVALGMAIAEHKPVALCCTSGTAMLNYAPAAAEALYQGVPLILITADRPIQWIDQDDSQTIRQFKCLSNIVKQSYDIPAITDINDENRWYVARIAADAVLRASSPKEGPVHINVQIESPLGGSIEYQDASPSSDKRIYSNRSDIYPSDELIERFASKARGKKILIVCGFSADGEALSPSMRRLAQHPDIEILTENISNIDLPYESTAIDTLFVCMDKDDRERLRPDIVISTGGALISRMLKEYLRNYSPAEHWHIGFNENLVDCFKSITANIFCQPAAFFSKMAEAMPPSESACDFSDLWANLRMEVQKRQTEFLETTGWSELLAFKEMIEKTPAAYSFFFSNGTPIRYAQLFRQLPGRKCYCNRGVSGIDGTNATAAGMAMASKTPVMLVSGDLSFSYDTGILGLNGLPDDFKTVVINNNGGGIFRYVRQSRCLEERERFFSATNLIPIEGIARAYGWHYFLADSKDSFKDVFDVFLSTPRALLEIIVDVEESASVLNSYLSPKLT